MIHYLSQCELIHCFFCRRRHLVVQSSQVTALTRPPWLQREQRRATRIKYASTPHSPCSWAFGSLTGPERPEPSRSWSLTPTECCGCFWQGRQTNQKQYGTKWERCSWHGRGARDHYCNADRVLRLHFCQRRRTKKKKMRKRKKGVVWERWEVRVTTNSADRVLRFILTTTANSKRKKRERNKKGVWERWAWSLTPTECCFCFFTKDDEHGKKKDKKSGR